MHLIYIYVHLMDFPYSRKALRKVHKLVVFKVVWVWRLEFFKLSVPIFPIIVIIRSFFLLVRLRNLTYVYPILLKITQWAFHLLFLYILVRSWSRNYQLFELFYLFPKMRQFQKIRKNSAVNCKNVGFVWTFQIQLKFF